MSFFSWLRNGTSSPSRRGRVQRRPTAPRFRPQLEALEDRCVPSTSALKVTNTADSGPGSLRYEIAQAQSNDTIVFDFGRHGNINFNNYPHTITLTSGELIINKNLTIRGPAAGLLTVTSTTFRDTASYGPSRIFEVDYGTVTLSGMTISHGDGERNYIVDPAFGGGDYYDGLGGGVLNFGALTISGCTLSDNFASGGNRYIYGGGGAIASFGTLTVSGCTLSNNITHAKGGGIYNAGALTVSGCTLSGNMADGTGVNSGGGIYNAGTLTVSACTLSGNWSNYGGGIANEGGTVTVSGCTVSGNSANLGGGGIYNAGPTLIVSNSVFNGNTPDNIEGSFTDGGGNTFT